MRLGCLLVFILVYHCLGAQGSRAHFIEANRMATEGNYRTAFALIKHEAENQYDCHALGYYWLWSLQYGKQLNDSTFSFNEKSVSKIVVSFEYQFKKQQMLPTLTKSCKFNGLINKAMGLSYWQQAMKQRANITKEERLVGLATNHLKLAVRGGAYDTFTTFNLARGLEYQAKFGEAIKYYKKTYDLDDSHINSLLKTSACYGKISEWDSCLSYANKAFRLTNKRLEKATALRLKAEAFAAKRNIKMAKKLFKTSVKMVPSDYDNNLAYIDFLISIKKKKKACKNAVNLLKNNVYHYHIHAAYQFMFEETERQKIYTKVLKMYDNDSTPYQHLKENLK